MKSARSLLAARPLRWLLARLPRATPSTGRSVAEQQDREQNLTQRAHLFAAIQAVVDQHPGCLHTLCEIGCGDGSALLHAAQTLTGFQWFIGIDRSESGIQRTREACDDPRFCFLSGEPVRTIGLYAGSGWCFFTSAEILNPVSWRDLDNLLFDIAARLPPAAFAIVEPVGLSPGSDVESSPGTSSFLGHNYLRLFQSAGWTVASFKFVESEPVGNLLLTAITTAFVSPST